MHAKIVVRLLDDAGALLAWAPLLTEARGDGTLRAVHPLELTVEQAGEASVLSYHWADVHAQSRVQIGPLSVLAGAHLAVLSTGDVALRIPSDEGPLPAVTVRGAVVAVPTGALSGG